ncbi:CDC25-like phosphatase Ych1p [[Candida] railenensis]|uniref:CDC25-like phosphatase Ych1p n=1 Tax=[Candida] railenensis TaxID=45579 RepID=A0A9P0W0N9_9ASCO|nr:CDC25-like phosphatase Ych1p [[Candida] railenensis]
MSRIYSLSDLKFINPSTLRAWFRGGSPTGKGKFAVVDVRDSDYVGGHIKGCFHYTAGNFHYTLPELYKKLIDNDINDVVFHCALSQVRGPSSTLKFLRSINELSESDQRVMEMKRVWVLKGGFTQWQEEYGNDAEVTEDYDEEIWKFGQI